MHAPNVWLITGASGGFGKCLVKSVLARGDRVIATARSVDKMRDLPRTDRIRLLQLDVTAGAPALKDIIAAAIAFWGRIDVLVNNAGCGAKGLVEEAGRMNVFGTLDATTAVLPYMRAERSGIIVMIGSRTSWRPELTVRSPHLHVLNHEFTHHSVPVPRRSRELGPFGIRMVIVEPAAFRTDALVSLGVSTDHPIPDYDTMRAAAIQRYKDSYRALRGDPAKAMETVVDVVRGEGAAAGKPWPLYLVLGDVGVSGVTEKCKRVTHLLEEWKELSTGLDIDPEAGA
ncbi:hypothetical protein FB451DRAFT_1148737 [Mycena latifolia]|nr:hypothetical protein FB451DRAFT_1148737 [Mycena latifolia]